ncbi:hypothetical protein GCM10009830_33070 [Glycomyces endophyticus]|uniref:Uncharacterized protein n=1 Tax=Glycomyces endophyticus TaxID=480996 RepID=A0ABN2H7I9_9ACTN
MEALHVGGVVPFGAVEEVGADGREGVDEEDRIAHRDSLGPVLRAVCREEVAAGPGGRPAGPPIVGGRRSKVSG